MKKFYSLLTALAVVLSASAVNLNVDRAQKIQQVQPTAKVAKKEVVTTQQSSVFAPMKANELRNADKLGKRQIKAMTKADGSSSIEGTWTFDLGDYYFQTSVGPISVDFEATLEDDYVWFEDPTNNELPFVGYFDSAASKITFFSTRLGSTGSYYVFQQPFVYNYQTQDLDYQNIEATFYPDNGSGYSVILFDSDNGIAWEAATDQNGNNVAGYFSIYDLEGATKPYTGGGGSDTGWTNIGNATLVDPWILPGFGADQWEEGWDWEVPLQQNVENPNLYRLVDPYHVGPASSINQSTTVGYIEFDVTDPDHVVFNSVNAGFAYSGAGISQFYCMNTLGMYVAMGYEADFVIEVMGDDMPYTTFKDGVVSLGYIVDSEGETVYDANFGIQGSTTGGYSWQDNSGAALNMTGKIVFPEGFCNGIMTTQLDMNQGMLEDTDLTDPLTYNVTATYSDGVLTIYNFAELEPIAFTVNLATGASTASDQVAFVDDYDPEYVFEYYYTDVKKLDGTVYAKVYNSGENQTTVVVDPWGEGLPEYDWFLGAAYYNTVITLNTTIPGLQAYGPQANIVSAVVDSSKTTANNASITVTSSYKEIPEGAVAYIVATDQDGYQTKVQVENLSETANSVTVLNLAGLVPSTDYTVTVYAQLEKDGAIVVTSGPKTVSFQTAEASAQPYLIIDDVNAQLDGSDVVVTFTYTANAIPANATLKVMYAVADRANTTPADYERVSANTISFTITNPEETLYWVSIQAEDANGYVIAISDRADFDLATLGILSVGAEENAPVRYFNLQGVELTEPEAGSIVIRVQGNSATKVLVK